jgi:hypothetical protein
MVSVVRNQGIEGNQGVRDVESQDSSILSQAIEMAAALISELVKKADANQDGKISKSEFEDLMKSFGGGAGAKGADCGAGGCADSSATGSPPAAQASQGNSPSQGDASPDSGGVGKDEGSMFDSLDKNRDGVVSIEELLAALGSALTGNDQQPGAMGSMPGCAAGGCGGSGQPAANGVGAAAGSGTPATTPEASHASQSAPQGVSSASTPAHGAGDAPAATTAADAGPSATAGKPKVSSFDTIAQGQGPDMTIGKDGKFVFNRVVDDSFLPPEVRDGMKQAVKDNMQKLDFFKDYFRNENDAYQYMVQMANLESGRGTTLSNSADAQGTGNGSSGYMHLHDKFGYEQQQWGRPLNTEGWSKDEALKDYSKYSTLVMRSLDANYHQAGADNSQQAAEKTMSMWWVGNQSTEAGKYYLSALSNGSGVQHNTGSIYA